MDGIDASWWQRATISCPDDRAPLRAGEQALICSACGKLYAVERGIPNLLGHAPASSRWRRAQAYELAFWECEDPRRRTERAKQNRRGAEGLARLLDAHVPGWAANRRQRMLQVGPAEEGELHYLQAYERYALEPLAADLAKRGLLVSGVRWIAGAAERLPFPDGHFSLILITNVLDHVADPRAVLSELHRCLTPKGVIWLSCHVVNSLLLGVCRLLHRIGWGYFAGHPWYFSRGALDRLCEQAGLRRIWSNTRRHAMGELGCSGSLRRRLKPLILQDRQLLLRAAETGAE